MLPAVLPPEMSNPPATTNAQTFRDLTPQQRRSGVAAWLGWMFDGLDMHLYTLVAAPFVMQLVGAASTADALVQEKSSWIQAAFLLGWALGGGFFGRVGDKLGRSRALCLTILTYALFTGLSCVAQTWWQLLIFRFLAALGIGGEWAVGSCLLSETWPPRWRPWIAAVLQTGVNIGVLFACLAVNLMAAHDPRWVFLVGVLPALLVFWIRRHVPEPEEWHHAKTQAGEREPGIADLFRGKVLPITLRTIVVCALRAHRLVGVHVLARAASAQSPGARRAGPCRSARSSWPTRFFLVIFVSIAGNFAAGGIAQLARLPALDHHHVPRLFRRDVPHLFAAARLRGTVLVLVPAGRIFLRRLRALHDAAAAALSRRCCARPARAFATISAASPPPRARSSSVSFPRSATSARRCSTRASSSSPQRSSPGGCRSRRATPVSGQLDTPSGAPLAE